MPTIPADELEEQLAELMVELERAIAAFEAGTEQNLSGALLALNRAAFDLALAAERRAPGEALGWPGEARRNPLATAAAVAAAAASLAALVAAQQHFVPSPIPVRLS